MLDMTDAEGELDLLEYLESAIMDASASLSLGLYSALACTAACGLRLKDGIYCKGKRLVGASLD